MSEHWRRPTPYPLDQDYTLAAELRRHMEGRDVLTDRAVQVLDEIARAGLQLVEKPPQQAPPMERCAGTEGET